MAKKLDIAASVTPAFESFVNISKPSRETTKAKIQELIKEESRLVKGIFQNFDCPGAGVKISIRKYPGMQPFEQYMIDGHEYEIPLYVARFLNGTDVSAGALGDPNKRNSNIGTCTYGVHGFKWDKNAQEPPKGFEVFQDKVGNTVVPYTTITKRVKRFGFQSLEFAGAV